MSTEYGSMRPDQVKPDTVGLDEMDARLFEELRPWEEMAH
jgi:hypothetical protein